ncbi:MAG: outer membrane beta-barrel family protein [Bacteroidales bacterium]|nr:outer membrane beta-barrel family protein [Bacteroidales bacterium]
MKKLFTLVLLVVCVNMALLAQYSVKFQLNDSTGEGEPYATVRIYRASDTTRVVTTGVTNLDGSYKQQFASPGDYLAVISAVGKVSVQRDFQLSHNNKVVDLGTIVIKNADNMLSGVTVTAHAPVISKEIDRIAYNVQNDDDAKTNTAFEMLRKVPLVTVDGQDNIMVKGSSNFKIYKNGHPDPTLSGNAKDVLKAIPASMIKKIEVITDPGAKYDAEGVGSILNIVTMDNSSMSGITGTVTIAADNYGALNPNAYITAQKGKVVTSLNYGMFYVPRHRGRQLQESMTHYNDTGNDVYSKSDKRNKGTGHFLNIESSWEPDTLNLVSMAFGGYAYSLDQRGVTNQWMNDAAGQRLYSFDIHNHIPRYSYYSFDGHLDYQHKTHVKDETLTLSYIVSTSRTHTRSVDDYFNQVNAPMSYTGYDTRNKENFLEHTFQFDWTRPFAKYHKIETGVKYIHRSNKSHTTMDYAGLDPDTLDVDNRLNHLTQVAAAYASYTFHMNSWSARAGLRYEYSYLKARYPHGDQPSFHTNLNDWVPSASVSYQMGIFNSLTLSFATTINRPGINYLNPAVISTPTSISYGNSHLKSARNYSVNLNYMHTGAKLTFTLTPNLSWSRNGITGIQTAQDDKMVSTYANELKSFFYGIFGYVQWQPFKTTSLYLNGSLGRQSLKSETLGLEKEGWSNFMWLNVTQQLPWKLRLTLGMGRFGGGPSSLYGRDKVSYWHDIALQRSFLKEDRLTVKLNANVPFSGKYKKWTSYTTQGDYTGWSSMKAPVRNFAISVSYRFGSLKAQVKKTNVTIENNDVVGGASKGQGGQQGGSGN